MIQFSVFRVAVQAKQAVLMTGIEKPVRKTNAVTQYGVAIDLSATLDALEIDQCFDVDTLNMRKHAFTAATRKSITLTSEKQADGRYRIWRVR